MGYSMKMRSLFLLFTFCSIGLLAPQSQRKDVDFWGRNECQDVYQNFEHSQHCCCVSGIAAGAISVLVGFALTYGPSFTRCLLENTPHQQ